MTFTQNFIVFFSFSLKYFIVFGDGTTIEKSLIYFKHSIHNQIISSFAKNELKIFVGKDDFGYPPFKGNIMDLRFYY